MKPQRVDRLNSLLKEVISEVLAKDVKDPSLTGKFISLTRVDVSRDLHHAVAYISIIGTPQEKKEIIEALNRASGFIGTNAAQKVTIRYFPALSFKLDDTVEKQLKIDAILTEISSERQNRHNSTNVDE